MIPGLVAPLVASLLLGVLGPAMSRRLSPSTVIRLFPMTAVLVALSTGIAICAFAVLVLARLDDLADIGRWSVGALPWHRDVPLSVGALAGGCALALLAAAGHRTVVLAGDLWAAELACRDASAQDSAADGRLADAIVIDDPVPRAVTVGALHGRIVISTGMLEALSERERDAVLWHERSHLRHRHHLSVLAVRIAAAADPVLRPLVGVVTHAVERWADEDAAAATGDRRLVATALARAGLAHAAAERSADGLGRPAAVLSVTTGDVPRRARALLGPAPRSAVLPVVAVVSIAVVATLAGGLNGMRTDHRIDAARAVYSAAGGH